MIEITGTVEAILWTDADERGVFCYWRGGGVIGVTRELMENLDPAFAIFEDDLLYIGQYIAKVIDADAERYTLRLVREEAGDDGETGLPQTIWGMPVIVDDLGVPHPVAPITLAPFDRLGDPNFRTRYVGEDDEHP